MSEQKDKVGIPPENDGQLYDMHVLFVGGDTFCVKNLTMARAEIVQEAFNERHKHASPAAYAVPSEYAGWSLDLKHPGIYALQFVPAQRGGS